MISENTGTHERGCRCEFCTVSVSPPPPSMASSTSLYDLLSPVSEPVKTVMPETPRDILYREVLDAYQRMSARAMELERELHAAKAEAKAAFAGGFGQGVEAMRALAVHETNRRRYGCSSCSTATQVIIDLQTAKVDLPST